MFAASVAVRGNTIQGNYSGNLQLKDEESTVGMVIPPYITNSRTSKPPEEWFSARNHKFMDEESTGGVEFRRESPVQGR
jgi:hypothetical protein